MVQIKLQDVVKIGNKVNLTKMSEVIQNNQLRRTYDSQIVSVKSGDTITITMPVYNGKIVPLNLNEDYGIIFHANRVMYSCVVKVMKRYKDDKIYILELKLQNRIVKYQRRKYYRIDCMFDFLVRLDLEIEDIDEDGNITTILDEINSSEDSQWYIGKTVNFSAGGVRFLSDKQFDQEDMLQCRLNVHVNNEDIVIDTTARIIIARLLPNIKMYEYRIEFTGLDIERREVLVKFVFEEERRIRRKEAGLG